MLRARSEMLTSRISFVRTDLSNLRRRLCRRAACFLHELEIEHIQMKIKHSLGVRTTQEGRDALKNLYSVSHRTVLLLLLSFAITARAQVSVLTYHYDNLRTGQNTQETTLTPANVSSTVNPNQFGRLFTRTVDNLIVGQPLYMPNLNIAGGTHNVVFVATLSGSVYAFDADSNAGGKANPLWYVSLLDTCHVNPTNPCQPQNSGETPTAYGGVLSTPVIDSATNIMYVEAKSQLNGVNRHRLHSLDILTGNEKTPGPRVIDGSMPGTNVTFSNIQNQMNRPGLLLANGIIYVAFGTACEGSPSCGQWYGWVFAYDEATLTPKVFNTTPNGTAGSVWMSGSGPAADSVGNVYFATGNGTFDSNSDYGNSILKIALINGSMTVIDSFTPFNQSDLNSGDRDVGSGGVLLLPDQTSSPQHLLVHAGKGGSADQGSAPFAPIHLIDRDHMGKYCGPPGGSCTANTGDTNIHQEISGVAAVGGMWSMPAYWNNKVYFWGSNDTLKAYTLSGSQLLNPPATSSDIYPLAANISISANGASNGILWAAEAVDSPASMTLNAYDANCVNDVCNRLYSSSDNSGRDNAGGDVHFIVPIVANGKVYLGGTQLSVYGQNPPDFNLSVSPTLQSFPIGGGIENYTVTVSALNNFNAPVFLTLTNLPANTMYSCSPNPVIGGSGTSVCTLTTNRSTAAGSFSFNICSSGGGISHNASGTLVEGVSRPGVFATTGASFTPYSNPANAEDGNPSTFSAAPTTAGAPGYEIWNGFGPISGTPSQITLKVTSLANCTSSSNDGVLLDYSLDGGKTFAAIYNLGAFGGPPTASRSLQTDAIPLPPTQNPANLQVLAEAFSQNSTGCHQIYDIWLEITLASPKWWPAIQQLLE